MNRLKILDYLTGNDYCSYLFKYRQTQWLSDDELHRYQADKLKILLMRIENNSPFYGKIIQENIDLENIKDTSCLNIFPVIEKHEVKKFYNNILHNRLEHIKNISKGWTGGTTGEPLIVYKDRETRSSIWGAYFRFYDWMGINYGDPAIAVWGHAHKNNRLKKQLKKIITRYLENVVYLNAYAFGQKKTSSVIDLFIKHKPVFLRGYAQVIKDMAMLLKDRNYHYPLKAISTTVDPLFDKDRELFKEVFGCDTFDQYGCGEVGSIAFECAEHDGLHVTNERCIVEVNEDNELIITDLDNYVMPIIRYKNGDIVEIDNKKCRCGRVGKKIKSIKGRVGDVVIGLNGRKVHPVFFNNILNDSYIGQLRNIKRYKVIQHDLKNLEWQIVCTDLTEEDKEYMIKETRSYLGDININIQQLRKIPSLKSGKYQFVQSKINCL